MKPKQWIPFLAANRDLCYGATAEDGSVVAVVLAASDGLQCYLHQYTCDPKCARRGATGRDLHGSGSVQAADHLAVPTALPG